MTAKPTGTWKRRLAGCAIGCGLLLAIAVVAFFSFVRWVSRSGPQIATEAIVGRNSSGFVRLQNLATDEGLLQFLDTNLERLDRRRLEELERSNAPAVVKWLARIGPDRTRRARQVTDGMPREITAVIESFPNRQPQLVVAANLARFPRLIKLGTSAMGLVRGVEVHGQHVYQDYGSSGSLAFVENTIVWTAEPDLMRTALDRIDQAAAEDPPNDDLHRAYRELAARWDLFGHLERAGEVIPWLLEVAARTGKEAADLSSTLSRLEPQLRSIEKARFGLDMVSDQVLEGECTLQLRDAAAAREWARLAETAPLTGTDFRISPTVNGRVIVIQIRTDRLSDWISEKLADGQAGPSDGSTSP